jgi:isopenicillin N synthase-like dioxygenase
MSRPFSDICQWEKEGCPLYEEQPWVRNDPTGEYTWINDTFQKYQRIMHDVAMKLVKCFAIGLGKEENYFDPWFKDECSSSFRVIHYLPRDTDFDN